MMFFKNLSIRYKILVPVALLGCLLIALAVMSIQSANQIMDAGEEISENYAVKIEQLGDISADYQRLRRVAFAHIIADSDTLQESLESEADSLKSEISGLCDEFEFLSTAARIIMMQQLRLQMWI